jgi:PP-loop superfamily ATP-utilizing enzyme
MSRGNITAEQAQKMCNHIEIQIREHEETCILCFETTTATRCYFCREAINLILLKSDWIEKLVELQNTPEKPTTLLDRLRYD